MRESKIGKKSKLQVKNAIVTGIAIALTLIITAFFWWGIKKTSGHSRTNPTQVSASSSPTPVQPKEGGKTYSIASGPTPLNATTTETLAAPTGQLLNKQAIALSSTEPSSSPSLQSVCQTLPNASCDIRLTNSSSIKHVGSQNTGSNGIVIFNWNAKTVGLLPGQWTVQTVVTQGTATGVSHSEYLTVQP